MRGLGVIGITMSEFFSKFLTWLQSKSPHVSKNRAQPDYYEYSEFPERKAFFGDLFLFELSAMISKSL
jgi:hypothetical protein